MKKLTMTTFILLLLINFINAQSKHEIGINYAPNYFIRTADRLLLQKQNKMAISHKIGFVYKYSLNNKIKILTGINYSMLKEHSNYDYVHSLPPSEYEFLYPWNSSCFQDRKTLSSSFYFIEIPFSLEYFISKNFYLSTGLNNTFFIKHELWTDINMKYKSIYNYSPYMIEYNLGIGFFIKLTNTINLYINPYFQTSINYFMSTKHLDVNYKNYVNQLGININITFNINKK